MNVRIFPAQVISLENQNMTLGMGMERIYARSTGIRLLKLMRSALVISLDGRRGKSKHEKVFLFNIITGFFGFICRM